MTKSDAQNAGWTFYTKIETAPSGRKFFVVSAKNGKKSTQFADYTLADAEAAVLMNIEDEVFA